MKTNPEVRMLLRPFEHPGEYQEFLADLEIGSQFNMRFRGLMEYYGKEFLAFKREKPRCTIRNEFLQIFSSYMTDYLDGACPPSWNHCTSPFWEELIFAYLPHCLKITSQEKEVENFLFELKKFVKILDKKIGTIWSGVVKLHIEEAFVDLKICERLLNRLHLLQFPDIHLKNWDCEKDFEQLDQQMESYSETSLSLYRVKEVKADIVILEDLAGNRLIPVQGLPFRMIKPDLLFYGACGRNTGQINWNWFFTRGIYPERAKQFMINDRHTESH